MTDAIVPTPDTNANAVAKPKMSVWRRVGEALAGSGIGFLVWSFLGPGMIGWWYEPPSKDAFSCASTVRSALAQFVTMQLVSAIGGAVLVTLVLLFSRRWWEKRKAAKAAAARPT